MPDKKLSKKRKQNYKKHVVAVLILRKSFLNSKKPFSSIWEIRDKLILSRLFWHKKWRNKNLKKRKSHNLISENLWPIW